MADAGAGVSKAATTQGTTLNSNTHTTMSDKHQQSITTTMSDNTNKFVRHVRMYGSNCYNYNSTLTNVSSLPLLNMTTADTE